MGIATCPKNLAPGDPCFIVVDSVNRPTGRWHGRVKEVVVSGKDPYQYLRVQAIIEDTQAPKEFQGHSPTLNYDVYPKTADFEGLFRDIDLLEKELESVRRISQIQIEMLLTALKAVTHLSLSETQVKALVENAVKTER